MKGCDRVSDPEPWEEDGEEREEEDVSDHLLHHHLPHPGNPDHFAGVQTRQQCLRLECCIDKNIYETNFTFFFYQFLVALENQLFSYVTALS